MSGLESYKSTQVQAWADKARINLAKSSDNGMRLITAMLRFYEVEASDKIQTAATNGLKIYFNPAWMQQMIDERGFGFFTFVYLHEIGHIMLFHCSARGRRAVKKWGQKICNIAMDHKVNLMLRRAGFDVPAEAVCDEQYTPNTMEEIATTLYEDYPELKDNHDLSSKNEAGDGGDDVIFDSGDGTGGDMEQHRQEVERKAKEALRIAHDIVKIQENQDQAKELRDQATGTGCGLGSRGMTLDLDLARENREVDDYVTELRDFVGADSGFDYVETWSKMDRAYRGGMLNPGKIRQTRARLGIILDTSGSMRYQLPPCVVELEILSQEGYHIHLVCCDGEIWKQDYEPGELDASEVVVKGGGGSDMAPAFEELERMALASGEEMDYIIMISDCSIYWPKQRPITPLLVLHVSESRHGDRFNKDSDFPEQWFNDHDDNYKVIEKRSS